METLFSPEVLAARPPIDEPIKQRLRDLTAIIPDGRRGAIVGIAEWRDGQPGARLHVAARGGDRWQVGGSVGWTPGKLDADVAVMWTW